MVHVLTNCMIGPMIRMCGFKMGWGNLFDKTLLAYIYISLSADEPDMSLVSSGVASVIVDVYCCVLV